MNDERPNSLLIVISAPSGTGKTSICRQFLAACPNVRFSVSHTTRAPRPGENDGKDYSFISETAFREMIARGEFVEWVENYGQFYGTTIKAIDSCLQKGFDIIIDVEPRGARKLKENYPGGIFVFVLPPSMDELKNRLINRGFEGEEAIRRRLNKAFEEIREVVWYDYVVCNDRIEEAVDKLRSIYVAEKARRERMTGCISGFFEV